MENQSNHNSGRDIFFYLLSFFTLGTVAVSAGGVLFAIINKYFSDQVVNYNFNIAGPSASALAALIVATPIYFLVVAKINKDVRAGITSVTSKVRKVLTYLVLFLACATVIGDVISLVYRFVAGDVNTRVFLKIATILVIGLWVIWYYWVNIKQDEKSEKVLNKWWHCGHLIAAGLVILGIIITGFTIIGSPAFRQKLVRDSQRVSDIQQISSLVQYTYDQSEAKALPARLSAIPLTGYNPKLPQDPSTKAVYEYSVVGDKKYELCATFETASEKNGTNYTQPYPVLPESGLVDWNHPAGRYCYNLQVVKTPVSK